MNARRLTRILLWVLIFDIVAGAVIYIAYDRYREQRFDTIILEAGRKYGVDPCLIKAVIWRETHFRANEVGGAGEIGLMQVMPTTGGDWAKANGRTQFSKNDLFVPATNIEAGAWYLRRGLDFWKQCDEPIPFAVAEYNAGRTNVRKWLRPGYENDAAGFVSGIGFPKTQRYVRDVLSRRDHYESRGDFKGK